MRSTINGTMILLCLLSVTLVGTMWIIQEYRAVNQEIGQLKDSYLKARKEALKTEVDRAISFIEYKRATTEEELMASIKSRVYEAHQIAEGIYLRYEGEKSDGEIQELIKEALRPLIFNEGRGYFFIYDMKGNNVLLPFSPQLEGTNLMGLEDSKGYLTIQETIKLIEEKGEGFNRWHWYKPGESDVMKEKIGFNKYFAPYDWWIGTGEYVEDFEKVVQKETLAWINKIRFGDDGYIFTYHYSGIVLAHFLKESIGSNVLEQKDDPYGRQIVGDLIALSQTKEADFLEYEGLIRPSTGERAPKIGYARSVDDWEWTVGAGVYVDEINETIAQNKQKLLKTLIRNLTTVLIIFLLTLLIIGLFIHHLSGKMNDHLSVFIRFFDKASSESVKINLNEVHLEEFHALAQSVNKMMDAREEAEQEVSRLRVYLANVIDSMPSVLAGVDKNHRITQWNREAEKRSGQTFSEAEGKPIGEVLPRLSGTYEAIDQALSQQQVFHESLCYTPEGEDKLIYEEVTIFPLMGEGAKGAVIRIDDITGQHELQEELAHSRRLDAVGQLAGGIAHDFNNMLAGIVGGAELIKREVKGNDRVLRFADTILQSGMRAGELSKKLLAFARKGTIASTPVSLQDILKETFAILEHSLDKQILLSQSIQTDNTMVEGDSIQLQNALINLGINAGHAMPDGGELVYTIKKAGLDETYCRNSPFEITPGDFLQIEVSDTGVGMAPKILKKIFEPFFTTREAGKGSGLGLAAVYGTIQQHRGAITVQSEVGRGTTFWIYLPLSDKKEKTEVNEDTPTRGSGTILVIDDEALLRTSASAILKGLGYKVILAEDGAEGLEIYRKEQQAIDLVLMDMIMPHMNGKECFYAMKEISPEVKVVLSSGFSQEEDVNDLKRDGLQGFIKKPYTTASLSRILSNLLN